MKKLLTAIVALSLFAACKGKGTDTANTSTTTPATTTTASTTTTSTPAAPAADPKEAFINTATDCVCQFYKGIADLNTKLEAATSKKDKEAIAKEMQAMGEKQPECLAAAEAEEAKITAGMSATDKEAFEKTLQTALEKKCPDAVATINKMNEQ